MQELTFAAYLLIAVLAAGFGWAAYYSFSIKKVAQTGGLLNVSALFQKYESVTVEMTQALQNACARIRILAQANLIHVYELLEGRFTRIELLYKEATVAGGVPSAGFKFVLKCINTINGIDEFALIELSGAWRNRNSVAFSHVGLGNKSMYQVNGMVPVIDSGYIVYPDPDIIMNTSIKEARLMEALTEAKLTLKGLPPPLQYATIAAYPGGQTLKYQSIPTSWKEMLNLESVLQADSHYGALTVKFGATKVTKNASSVFPIIQHGLEGGISFAVYGPSGSGKSVLISALVANLSTGLYPVKVTPSTLRLMMSSEFNWDIFRKDKKILLFLDQADHALENPELRDWIASVACGTGSENISFLIAFNSEIETFESFLFGENNRFVTVKLDLLGDKELLMMREYLKDKSVNWGLLNSVSRNAPVPLSAIMQALSGEASSRSTAIAELTRDLRGDKAPKPTEAPAAPVIGNTIELNIEKEEKKDTKEKKFVRKANNPPPPLVPPPTTA